MRFILLITMILCSQFAFGLQVKVANDNATIKAKISSNILNRIYVIHDRISEVFGMEGTYQLQKDEEEGSIFILPETTRRDKNLNLFVKTESGKHYALTLECSASEAQTIAIKPLLPNQKVEKISKKMFHDKTALNDYKVKCHE